MNVLLAQHHPPSGIAPLNSQGHMLPLNSQGHTLQSHLSSGILKLFISQIHRSLSSLPQLFIISLPRVTDHAPDASVM